MDLQSRIGNPPDDGFDPADLFWRNGIEVVSIRISGVVFAGDRESILAAQDFFVFFIPPERDTHHHIGKTIPRDLDQSVGRTIGWQSFIERRHPVKIEGRLSTDENGQIDTPRLLAVDKCLPFADIHFLRSGLMFVGRKEETTPAS